MSPCTNCTSSTSLTSGTNVSRETDEQRVIVTVVGKDRVGIIAGVAGILAEYNVNILDISQTILQDFFTMIMIVNITRSTVSLQELQQLLKEKGKEIGVQIHAQHEDVFKYMHRI